METSTVLKKKTTKFIHREFGKSDATMTEVLRSCGNGSNCIDSIAIFTEEFLNSVLKWSILNTVDEGVYNCISKYTIDCNWICCSGQLDVSSSRVKYEIRDIRQPTENENDGNSQHRFDNVSCSFGHVVTRRQIVLLKWTIFGVIYHGIQCL